MIIKLNVTGGLFKDKAPLANSIIILNAFNSSFENCINITTNKHPLELLQHKKPSIYITESSISSLNIETLLEASTWTAAGFLPEIALYSWHLFEKSYKLVSFLGKIFKENNSYPAINITDSPGASVNFNINNGSISASKDVVMAAKQNEHNFKTLSKELIQCQAKTIDINNPEEIDDNLVTFNNENKNYFNLPKIKKAETEVSEYTIKTYRFNTKTNKGLLDLYSKGIIHQTGVPFLAVKGNTSSYIDSLKHTSTLAHAKADTTINAFGEKEYRRLYVYHTERNE
jgi:hypothetical protein